MKRKRLAFALSVITLLCFAVGIGWAVGGNNSTSITDTKDTITGNKGGPWNVSSTGTVQLDKTVKQFNGLQYYLSFNGTQYNGFVNLPNGNPTPGGAAVAWNGSKANMQTAGTYGVVCNMSYVDGNGNFAQMAALSQVVLQ